MTRNTQEITLRFPEKELMIRLLVFESREKNGGFLLDTGCILHLLKHLPSFIHRLEKSQVRIGIIKRTIDEVVEHLWESYESKKQEYGSTFGVVSGFENFRKLIMHDRIEKFTNPKTKLTKVFLKTYCEDSLLVCALQKGDFKAIVTTDKPLTKKLPKDRTTPCQELLT